MSNKKQQQAKQQQAKSTKQVVGKSGAQVVLLWLSAILIITYIAYFPSLKNGFTNWDDNVYIPENSLIKSLSANNIKHIFDTKNEVSLNYHPITILSFAIDYKLSGYNPKTFHFTNILFHLLNTALVFWFIFLLSDKKIMVAAITSILFGIHPMHVESVTWISERKDVLYVFFFLWGLVVYLKYLQQQGGRKYLFYALMLALFVLSVLSKAMAIVFPFILLLIDYYNRRKFDKNVILEKLPFLALSIYFGLLAVNIQSHGAIGSFAVFSIPERICFASYGIVSYMYKLVVPLNLTCFYAYPSLVANHLPVIYIIAPVIVIFLLGGTAYLFNKNKVVVFGFLFFLVTVAMVLQFISVGKAIMAERYTYLSYIGLFFPLAMGYQWLQDSTDKKMGIYKQLSMPLLAVLLIFFFYTTYQRTKVWVNSDVLWTDAIEKNPNNETAYTNRGSYLVNRNSFDIDKKNTAPIDFDRALNDFNISIRMNANNPKVFTNRANIYGTKQQFELSLQDYSAAIKLDSTDAEVFANRAVTYSIMQQYDKAIADYTKAISMRKNFTVALQNRAYAYVSSGQYQKGVDELSELIKEDASKPDYYVYRGVAFFNLHNYTDALTDFNAALQVDPNNSRAYYNRAATYERLNNYKAAYADALKAKSLGYPVEDAYLNKLGNQH